MPFADNKKIYIEIISLENDAEVKEWDSFVNSHAEGTPYHLSCWLRTIQKSYSFTPFLYVYRQDNGVISDIFPIFLIKSLFTGTRVVSLPFSDYGGPLFSKDTDKREFLNATIRKYDKAVKCIEIRKDLKSETNFICYNYYKHYILDLADNPAEIKSIVKKRTIQHSIRKAVREGVEIKEANNQYGINEFYRLNAITRKKHGVPSQPKRFFENLLEFMIRQGHGFILLAAYKSKILGASIFFTAANQIHYKYNASDTSGEGNISPNHLLIWHAIQRGIKNGYRLFDLGRTSPDNKGLMRFKSMWGNKCIDLPYYYYPKVMGVVAKRENGIYYTVTSGLWRLLPDVVQAKIGPLFYRHLG